MLLVFFYTARKTDNRQPHYPIHLHLVVGGWLIFVSTLFICDSHIFDIGKCGKKKNHIRNNHVSVERTIRKRRAIRFGSAGNMQRRQSG
ncbi:unnamed protein product [Caenorhabditis auriculariae]|uniref:Uncharacterized protein n=1 Tax=Caenorhabditis auriculariae TaxID=2777116 RepID=A0A8S1H7S6_9PELO|nr:unnamed protein product [Caenorhabditis auriculariae]